MRCQGWTSAAVDKLMQKNGASCEVTEPRKKLKTKNSRDYEGELSAALAALGVTHERNYKFLTDRRFRFDFAFPDKKVAVEFEGAIYVSGRHTRGKGYAGDCKKYTLATLAGWQLWRYTSDDVKGSMGIYALAVKIKEQLEACS